MVGEDASGNLGIGMAINPNCPIDLSGRLIG